MEQKLQYPRADRYPDLTSVYANCSGPGGLKVAEFLCDKIQLAPGTRVLDIGTNYGFQTCFIAKEYQVDVIGIDPWQDHAERVQENAIKWGIEDSVLAMKVGVPETTFASASFNIVYSTTTFEMFRGMHSQKKYLECLQEVFRILRPGGRFAYGEPMHIEGDIPADLAPIYTKGHGVGAEGWAKCFATVQETVDMFTSVGFEVLEAGEAPDAWLWWEEYCQYDPDFIADPNHPEARVIRQDGGRWLTYGYVIARKPE